MAVKSGKNLAGLKRDLKKFLGTVYGAGTRVYTKKEWKEKGEQYGVTADLTLVIEGSPLYNCLNYGEPSWDASEQLRELASNNGYYYEQGYAWSVHFYEK